MANFIKAAIIGEAEGEEIVNILYYAPATVNPTIALSAEERELVGAEIATLVAPDLYAPVSDDYIGRQIDLTAVDEFGNTTSDYAVIVPWSGAGTFAGGSDTVGLAAIVGFRVSYPFTGAPIGAARVPKRSYIALGPLASGSISDAGLVAFGGTLAADAEAALSLQVDGGADTWVPVRIGRGVSPDFSIGKVDSAVVRPYARPRKSRMKRANAR